MEERSVTHNTFVIERTYPTTTERVFAAFADPIKKRRWFAEVEGFEIEKFEMDFRVGGIDRIRFRFQGGVEISNDTSYLDILPNHRIVIAYSMTVGDKRISSSLATMEFLPAPEGTKLIFTEQGAFFDGFESVKSREEGSRDLLERLAKELAR